MEYGAEFLYNSDIKPTVKVSRGSGSTVYLQAVGAYEANFMRQLCDIINEHMNLARLDLGYETCKQWARLDGDITARCRHCNKLFSEHEVTP